jgi:hypothetical protein
MVHNYHLVTCTGKRSIKGESVFTGTARETFTLQTRHLVSVIRRSRIGNCSAAVCHFLVVAVACGSPQAPKLPRFEDHRVRSIYRGAVKAPDFGSLAQYSGSDLRCFGGSPSGYRASRVNFAGHFVIDTCSCGSGCHYFFIWDALTGKVYQQFPFGAINVGPYGDGPTAVRFKGEQFQPDSSLLVLEGCLEGTCDCAKRYYNWSGSHFTLFVRQPSQLPPDCRK